MSDTARQLHDEGDAHCAAGRLDAALASFQAGTEANPTSPWLPFNAGNMLRLLGRTAEAIAAYDVALARAPGFTVAHHNKATCLLQLGELRAGFLEYEWRKRCPTFVEDSHYTLPRPWQGEDLRGKTLYIFPELYQGDLIQFGRYALLAQQLGARVLLGAPVAMHALLQTMSPALTLIDADVPPPEHDYQCALMSLPLRFATTLETIPRAPRYLLADPERVETWRRRIGGDGFKIGIVWQGSVRAAQRSFPLALSAEAIGRLPGVRLISLQKYEGLDQLADLPLGLVETLGDDFDPGPHAFVDTAAAIMCCDLVVSADTSVAHVAGALGAPVWLATAQPPDWRWLEERTDTPWYPAMRLFRQREPGEWAGVFGDMRAALETMRNL